MNQRDFIRSKKDDVLYLMSQDKTSVEIATYLASKYNYEYQTFESFARAVRAVMGELLEDIQELQDQIQETKEKLDDYLDDEDEMVIDELEYQKKYLYVKDDDEYFFFISNPPIVLSGDLIRALKKEYSNMTGPSATINEICRKYKITRKIFVKVKTILGWTHDDDPFTLEELSEDTFDIDAAVQSMILDKKNELSKKFIRDDFRVMSRAARKWFRFEENLINPFIDLFNEKIQEKLDLKLFEVISQADDKDPAMGCVLAPFDLHYGKYASPLEVGEGLEYSKEIAREVLMKATKSILDKAKKHNIEEFIVPIGSDFFHVDNPRHTTTAGTPQDMDGTFIEMASEGNKLMIQFIDTLKQLAPVRIVLCAGNHDYSMSHQLLEVVQAWYRNDPDVEVDNQRKDRTYLMYGNCMLGFSHGDGAKMKDLPNLMMRDNKKMYAMADFHAFFTGHLHHEIVRDVNGVKMYQMPSLSGSDRWHHKNGYEYSIRGLVAYLIHPEKGIEINILDNII